MTGQLYIGRRQLRREDDVMLTGEARYTDDMAPDGCTYMQVVRADVPHARLLGVDARDAESMPGVLGVFTASDLRAAGIGPIPSFSRTPPFRVIDRHGGELPDASQYPLAEEKVRYLGEPVAFVVAESRSAAQDAAEAVVMSEVSICFVFTLLPSSSVYCGLSPVPLPEAIAVGSCSSLAQWSHRRSALSQM